MDTPSDFGNRGGTPSHPELLEWLAWDFVKHGWDVKRLQRQILTSSTYRQSSEFSEAKSSQDGDDRLLWRFPLVGWKRRPSVIRSSKFPACSIRECLAPVRVIRT